MKFTIIVKYNIGIYLMGNFDSEINAKTIEK